MAGRYVNHLIFSFILYSHSNVTIEIEISYSHIFIFEKVFSATSFLISEKDSKAKWNIMCQLRVDVNTRIRVEYAQSCEQEFHRIGKF